LTQLNFADIHYFSVLNQNILLDVNSGSVHLIDECTMSALDALKMAEGDFERAAKLLNTEENEALVQLKELVKEGLLFTPDETGGFYQPPATTVKSLCLNISHDCNLACGYCFAAEGSFGGQRLNMPLETAKKAIDYLLANTKRTFCEVDFFGGEPLLNISVVQATVEYARAKAADVGKTIKFTLTTNAVGLTPKIEKWLDEAAVSVILSHDGRQKIHDTMRYFPNGRGSYDVVSANIGRYVVNHPDGDFYIRGTYTNKNLDFVADVEHWLQKGWRRLSMEPVVEKEAAYRIKEEDLPKIKDSYNKLARLYDAKRKEGQPFEFFHFNIDLQHGPCLLKRLTGCGAGHEYLVVTPEGDLYPCHQFVGREAWRLGNLATGIERPHLVEELKTAHVYNKPVCKKCWARFYCSGGCQANAQLFNNNLLEPYEIGCKISRLRLEYAIWVAVVPLA